MQTLRKIGHRLNALAGVGREETMFYEADREQVLPDPPKTTGVSIRRMLQEDVAELSSLAGLTPQIIQVRLQAGDVCYLAHFERLLAHFSWVKLTGVQPVTEAACAIPIKIGEFWIYHCWTESWSRGRSIYPSVLATILRDHFEAGFSRGHIYTSKTNLASQRGIQRAGFHHVSAKRSLRIGSHWFPVGRE